MLATAKVFTTGNSQAIRLPKPFRVNVTEPKFGSYPVAGNTSGCLNGPSTGAILSLT